MSTKERLQRIDNVMAALLRRNGIMELAKRRQLRAFIDQQERQVLRELIQAEAERT